MSGAPKQRNRSEADDTTGQPSRPSTTGGGGGTYDGMESRIARLEASTAHMERDVGELRFDMKSVLERLTRLEERVGHLPGKGYIDARIIVLLAAVAALVTFQQQIQSFVGFGP